MSYDVVIVGGAMMGSSIAWWLSRDFEGSIAVVEMDPTYEKAATTHTNSCIRQQFSSPLNIAISQFGAEFIGNFRHYMGEEAPEIPIQSFGYLYLADSAGFADVLRANHATQAAAGAATRLLTREEIAADFPFYQLDDILLGSHNPVDEGYFDGGTIFDWFRKGAKARGVTYIQGRVTGMTRKGSRVTGVTLEDGTTLLAGAVVNCAGTRASATAQMAGLPPLPIEPRMRFTFVFDAAEPLGQDLPLTIDPSGVHVRSDGRYYLAGCPPDEDPAVDPTHFAVPPNIWEDKVWPAIATRVPAFERVKLINEWAGHYDFNRLDQNAILGPHPEVENFYFCNGFSGHGLQQSIAVGRGLAEHLATGAYRTLDLGPLGYERVLRNEPLRERAVI